MQLDGCGARGLAAQTVQALMRAEFITIDPAETLLEADRLMRLTRIRHLPVVQRGVLVGILSYRDVIETLLERIEGGVAASRRTVLESIAIRDVMAIPETVHAGCTLERAAERMLILRIGCLPVVEEGDGGLRMLGLVTESDLLRAAYVPRLAAI